jgi:hypothetical protein
MSAKILDDIFDSIVSTASAMSVAGGYNYNWGSFNNLDPQTRTYPAGVIEIESETTFTGNHLITKYTNDVIIVFKAIPENPSDLGNVAGKLSDDFKRLIATNFETYRAIGMMDFEYENGQINFRLPNDYPIEVELRFKIKYRQEKLNPSST